MGDEIAVEAALQHHHSHVSSAVRQLIQPIGEL
jgi:hypothetical protein